MAAVSEQGAGAADGVPADPLGVAKPDPVAEGIVDKATEATHFEGIGAGGSQLEGREVLGVELQEVGVRGDKLIVAGLGQFLLEGLAEDQDAGPATGPRGRTSRRDRQGCRRGRRGR